jgi:putative ABC transport system substrate-binding protein
MKRREFIAGLGSAAVAWPTTAWAQQAAMPVIGFLHPSSPDLFTSRLLSFRQGLAESGYVEGQNVLIEYRWGNERNDQVPAFAADLVRRQVAVLVAGGNVASMAAKAATDTTPIVFLSSDDPVKLGLVASMNRPGGNATGMASLDLEVGPKRLEVLHEFIPAGAPIALLVNQEDPARAEFQQINMLTAARVLGRELHVLRASTDGDLATAFATLLEKRAGALVIGPDTFFNSRIKQLANLTVRHRVAAVYQFREFVAAGGLMSYGGSLTDTYMQVGRYVGRILKGDKPADLPVEQTVKIELFINSGTAKSLGLTIPLSLLGRADEVIE